MQTKEHVEAIKNMIALPSDVRDECISLMPDLTSDEQRKGVEELTAINEKLLQNSEQASALYEKAKKIFVKAQKEFAPKIRKLQESSEREEDLRHVGTLLE